MSTEMQFRLLHLFATIALASMLLAAVSTTTTERSVLWASMAGLIGAIAMLRNSYYQGTPNGVGQVLDDCLYLFVGSLIGGFLGLIIGVVNFNYTGWFGGYVQWIVTGMATVPVVGMQFPRIVRGLAIFAYLFAG